MVTPDSFNDSRRKRLLTDFARKHATARDAIAAWTLEVEAVAWRSGVDVKARFPSVSFVGNDRLVFNREGTTFDLMCKSTIQLKSF